MKYVVYLLMLSGVFSFHCRADETNFDFGSFSNIPNSVFTPVRMEQTVANTPGAVTIVTGQQIKDLGIKKIVDVLKLVPGFNAKGEYVNRGNITPTPRRLQVLVDGVSQVRPLVGIVVFSTLPVPIENIARIEVTRSQAAASYGANSFLGVINIITKHPNDRLGTEFHFYGSGNGNSNYVGYADRIANTSLSIDYKSFEYDQYDTRVDSDLPKDDDLFYEIISAQVVSHLRGSDTLSLSFSGMRGDAEVDSIRTIWGTDFPVVEYQANESRFEYEFNSKNHTTSIAASYSHEDSNYQWETCGPRAFFYPGLGDLVEDYLLSGVDLQSFNFGSLSVLTELVQTALQLAVDPTSYDIVCGISDADIRFIDYGVEVNDVWEISDRLRVSNGFFLNSRSIESKTYGNGVTKLEKSQLFSNFEFLLGDVVTLNIGTFIESFGHKFDDPEFSPRFGLNIHLTPNSTAKLVLSRGKRLTDGVELIDEVKMPTYFDEEVYGSTTQYSFVGYEYIKNIVDHVETIDSVEFIYINSSRVHSAEVRIFQEDMKDILDNQASIFRPQWPFSNIKREGVEFSLSKKEHDYEFGVSAYFIDSTSKESIFEQYSIYGGNVYVIRSLPKDFKLSAAYYGTSKYYYGTETAVTAKDTRLFNEDARYDLRLVKTWYLGTSNIDFEILYSFHKDSYELPSVPFAPDESGERDNKSEITLGVSGRF